MSDPIVKGAKRASSRPAPQSASTKPSAKSRKVTAKSAKPKPKRAAAEKAPVRKAAPAKKAAPSTKTSKTSSVKAKKSKSAPKKATGKERVAAKKKSAKPKTPAKKASKRAAVSKSKTSKTAPKKKAAPKKPVKKAAKKGATTPASRQASRDEAAALKAFERAHKEFVRGNFSTSRDLFRKLIVEHAGVSEVTARARTYLNIAESRLRSESSLPRDADALYDRGVIELNRGDFVAAQEMFERSLKRDPEAADTLYALAATRARLGAVEPALQSLERAVELKPVLRVRAQTDTDFVVLRNEPEFERIIFPAQRP